MPLLGVVVGQLGLRLLAVVTDSGQDLPVQRLASLGAAQYHLVVAIKAFAQTLVVLLGAAQVEQSGRIGSQPHGLMAVGAH
ncbi:hypothetical protein D3C81_2100360 [compost metagenome]